MIWAHPSGFEICDLKLALPPEGSMNKRETSPWLFIFKLIMEYTYMGTNYAWKIIYIFVTIKTGQFFSCILLGYYYSGSSGCVCLYVCKSRVSDACYFLVIEMLFIVLASNFTFKLKLNFTLNFTFVLQKLLGWLLKTGKAILALFCISLSIRSLFCHSRSDGKVITKVVNCICI